MIREYARHVQNFTASADNGLPLTWAKLAKATWRVRTGGALRIVASYQVYANELTVRTSHLDASHGYFNGACVFMYVDGRTNEPLRLAVETPAGWRVSTGLNPLYGDVQMPEPRPEHHLFIATDYDDLVDSPVECGTHRLLAFHVAGVLHEMAIWGHGNEDEARLIKDTRRIVEVQRKFFGGLPYSRYTLILHLVDARGGGLEHRSSVTNQVNRWSFRPERSYERYLALTSHELFHAWNGKRLRPQVLGPFDYQRENYTRLLWLVEGATSYYDELLLVRAGLITPARYLELLAAKIVNLQQQPGRLIQSLAQSSFDAWIKLYRPDENSANSSVSYYLKGSLVCMLLDMAIRVQSGGEASLDDLLRQLYFAYPLNGPGLPEVGAVEATAEDVAAVAAGTFSGFFADYVFGTTELDYAAALAVVGLELRWLRQGPRAWLGLNFRRQGERILVSTVRADGPAYRFGVYADDELLAFNGWRVDEERLQAYLAECEPGQTVRLTLFRGDALIEVPVTLVEAPRDRLELIPLAQRSTAQLQAYTAWLGVPQP